MIESANVETDSLVVVLAMWGKKAIFRRKISDKI